LCIKEGVSIKRRFLNDFYRKRKGEELDWKKGMSDLDLNAIKHDMKNIGESLRQRRKEINISLKEAENATSIRMPYLQALEEGDLSKLISPIYAQGFFRQYAAFLGIDGEQIIRQHPEVFSRSENQEFAYGIGTLETRGNPGAGVKWFPNAIWIIMFILVLLIAWYLSKLFGVL
jgi:cytoskeletal protein RodZ